jgi:hypothetical protein
MANRRKIWVYSPRKPPKPGVPEAIKQALDAKAGELVASTLQPRHVQPAPAALRCVCSGCRPRCTILHARGGVWHKKHAPLFGG